MGCSGSTSEPPAPPVLLNALPTGLKETITGAPAASPPRIENPETANIPLMVCPNCRQHTGKKVAPVIQCSGCGAKCLPPPQRGDLTFQIQVPSECGAGSGSPFGLPLASVFGPNDKRAVLIVPPVELSAGTVLTVAVNQNPPEDGNYGEHFDFEGIIVKIDPAGVGPSNVPVVASPVQVAEVENLAAGQEAQGATASSGGFSSLGGLKGGLTAMAKKGMETAVSSASDALNSKMAAAAARPKTVVLRSDCHYFGPVALARPTSGMGAGMAAALGYAFPCGSCGKLIKGNDKCPMFRCGSCGVLSTFPVPDKEQLIQAQIPNRAPRQFIVRGPDQRKVLIKWPVSNKIDTHVVIAVPPPGWDFGKVFVEAFFSLTLIPFILDPVGAVLDGAAFEAGVNYAIDGIEKDDEPDVTGRVVGMRVQ